MLLSRSAALKFHINLYQENQKSLIFSRFLCQVLHIRTWFDMPMQCPYGQHSIPYPCFSKSALLQMLGINSPTHFVVLRTLKNTSAEKELTSSELNTCFWQHAFFCNEFNMVFESFNKDDCVQDAS